MRPEITAKKTTHAPSPPVERKTYTVEEAAEILGICRALAYRKGVLPTVQIAGRRLVPRQALERMLAETATDDHPSRSPRLEKAEGGRPTPSLTSKRRPRARKGGYSHVR